MPPINLDGVTCANANDKSKSVNDFVLKVSKILIEAPDVETVDLETKRSYLNIAELGAEMTRMEIAVQDWGVDHHCWPASAETAWKDVNRARVLHGLQGQERGIAELKALIAQEEKKAK